MLTNVDPLRASFENNEWIPSFTEDMAYLFNPHYFNDPMYNPFGTYYGALDENEGSQLGSCSRGDDLV